MWFYDVMTSTLAYTYLKYDAEKEWELLQNMMSIQNSA